MKLTALILKLFAQLPMRILYLFSHFLFFLNYYLIRYRKKVVYENLKNSFPEKSHQELKIIEKKFFKNFSDYIVENIKSFNISEKELRVRVQHLNQKVFHDIYKEKKNIILLSGHIFNWEWLTALKKIIPQTNTHPVYKKINHPFWEKQMLKIRNQFGNQSIETQNIIKHIIKTPNDGNSIYMFVADQSPHFSRIEVGLDFLNQKTPVFTGYDKLATRFDLAFVYCEIKKIKQGFYQINYHRIYPDNQEFKEYEVVKKFHNFLENNIKKYKDNYLWSHKRWKYKDSIKKMI